MNIGLLELQYEMISSQSFAGYEIEVWIKLAGDLQWI
jgi:hypothetical protein